MSDIRSITQYQYILDRKKAVNALRNKVKKYIKKKEEALDKKIKKYRIQEAVRGGARVETAASAATQCKRSQ